MKKIFPFAELHSPNMPIDALSLEQMELIQRYNERIRNGSVEFVQVPCLCGGQEFELLASFDRYSFQQATVICTQCGLIQSNPRMAPNNYEQFYTSDSYRKAYESDDYLSRYAKQYTLEQGEDIFKEVSKVKKIGPNVSVLEVGAGGGWNLLIFKEMGATVQGVDYSPSLVKLGLEHNIPMAQGSVENLQGKYDVIILNHVFEHFLDPIGSLKKMIPHLNKGGIFYIAVPNIVNSTLTQFQNVHTYYFDPETFLYYCFHAGLSCIKSGIVDKFHMFGVFDLSGSTNLTLEGHYQRVQKRFYWIKMRRGGKNFFKAIGLYKVALFVYSKIMWRL